MNEPQTPAAPPAETAVEAIRRMSGSMEDCAHSLRSYRRAFLASIARTTGTK